MTTDLEMARARLVEWRRDPVRMVVDEFHATPDEWQADALRAFADPSIRRIAMKACKGPGKTALLAWCIWNFLSCYGDDGSHPKGAATSITQDNIDDNLWPELAKWQARSEWFKTAFEWQKTRIVARDHPETWFFSKRTWPRSGDKQQQANTLAGLHADFLFFVLDESGGIPGTVMVAAEGGLSTGRWGKIMQGGNPTHLEGPLYDACTKERGLWHVVEITGDPDDPKRSSRISVQWAREQIEKYGIDNPWVLVNVFGRFPPASINALLGPDEVSAAMARHYNASEYDWSQKRLGIDVARFGDDRTVLFPRQGLAAFKPVVMRNARSTDIAARVLLAQSNWQHEMEFIDDTGTWGAGVVDNLIAAGRAPVGIRFGAPAIDARFRNRRAEMWIAMSKWVKRAGALPNIPEMVGELTTPTYTFASGKFVLEEKDQIKSRLGRSPDLADALALTFALPEMPGKARGLAGSLLGGGRVVSEYDPFAESRGVQSEYDPYDDRRRANTYREG